MSQPIAEWPADESPGAKRPASRRSRGVWVVAAIGAVCLVFTSLAGWKYATRPRSRLGGTFVSARTMPDGTVLVLEQVTTKKPHEMAMTRPGGGTMLSSWIKAPAPANLQRFSVHSFDNSVVLWLTRWHPALPDSQDFDWWLTSILTDAHGEQIEDGRENSHVISAAKGMSTRGADRPWTPLARAKGDVVIATSQFPAQRQTAGSRKVSVYDRNGAPVAEFDVPFPDTSTTPQWTPDSLPASKTSDDVRVTFTDVSVKEQPLPPITGVTLTHRRPRWSVTPIFSVERNGAPAPDWKAEPVRLTDALGNSASDGDCRLSVHERAWKLELTLSRDAPQAFMPEEQWESPPVALPATDSRQEVDQQGKSRAVGVRLVAVGRGAVPYPEFARTHGGMARRVSSPGRVGEKRFGVSHSSSSGVSGPTVHNINISGDCAHLLLKLDHLPPAHRELFRVHDDQGRELPHQVETFTTGDALYVFVFVDPAADAQSLRVTVYAHTARIVELLFAPPAGSQSNTRSN